MLIAIHNSAGHEDPYLDGWAECLAAHGADVSFVDLAAPGALGQLEDCDGVMWHWRQSFRDRQIAPVLRVIEFQLGIPVFPDFTSSWHRRNKLAQFYLLQAAGLPMPETRVFWNEQDARAWARQAAFPVVVKLSPGGGGKDVALLRSAGKAMRHIDRMFGNGIYPGQLCRNPASKHGGLPQRLKAFAGRGKAALAYLARGVPPRVRGPEQGYVYFQEYIEANEQTVGISVIGQRSFGALSVRSEGGFRTDGDMLDYDPSKIDSVCVRLAFDACRRLGSPMMAFDMLLRDKEPLILEMNFRNGRISGYWNKDLEWIDSPVMPQEAQVELFIERIRDERAGTSSYSAASLT